MRHTFENTNMNKNANQREPKIGPRKGILAQGKRCQKVADPRLFMILGTAGCVAVKSGIKSLRRNTTWAPTFAL